MNAKEPLGRRPSAKELLRELGGRAKIVVFLASAPGAGKTRRLLDEARRMRQADIDAVIGAIELKGRPGLAAMAQDIPRVPARTVRSGPASFEEFDFDAALAMAPAVIVLDELAHANLDGSVHEKRWQDALALRERGITVLGAFNIAHLETVAVAAESLTGHPVREIIPLSFLQASDEVIALDASPRLLRTRLRTGKIVQSQDVDRALEGAFKEATLELLRQLLLRTIDDLTIPHVRAEQVSTAAAVLLAGVNPAPFLRRTFAVASALDLALEVAAPPEVDLESLSRIARELNAEILRQPIDLSKGDISEVRASLIAIPAGALATKLVSRRFDRDLFIVAAGQTFIRDAALVPHPYAFTVGDRMRIGYGKLTVYFGAAAGCGKTYAMLDRGQQLKAEGIDIVAGFIETHGRKETAELLEGLEVLPRKSITSGGITYEEFDRKALLRRKPTIVLVDELAHTNAPGSAAEKRYGDVLALLRAGIDVITTLNVQHLEALGDAVARLTGTIVRETLPDGILALADELILVDVTPETLRDRLRAGKIYPQERVETALSRFFRTDNLLALRELALREALRARNRQRIPAPFERLLLSVASRPQDVALIKQCSRIAARLEVELAVAFVTEPASKDARKEDEMHAAARNERATWIRAEAANVPQAVLTLARKVPETTIAVAGTLRTPGFLQRRTFAHRLLDAGALELLVLAPRDAGGGTSPERR
ncbi:MAG TPA: hypothetical protein VIG32_10685 [Candidatus Baltobacteraceae bacterium]|jgi:two-component system sensor histidine kinase KdpD